MEYHNGSPNDGNEDFNIYIYVHVANHNNDDALHVTEDMWLPY